MANSLIKLAASIFLLQFLAAGITGCSSAQQASLDEEKTSSSDAEVMVTISVPEGKTLSGTAIITLEDITIQDTPSVQLATVRVPASTLAYALPTVAIPVDLRSINSDTNVNVAVHIDSDNDGLLSNGDWISDSIVNVINNGQMAVIIDIVKIGV